MDADELIRLQLELQCIGVTSDGLLVRIPGANPDEIARVYITRHNGGCAVFMRHDLPSSVREQINGLLLEPHRNEFETITRLLGEHVGSGELRCWRTHIFPDWLTPGDYPDAVRLDESHQPLVERYDPTLSIEEHTTFAIIVRGLIVSTCESARENARAAEAWVRTLPGFRRRGYARQVTAAWGHCLQRRGKVPFYSHAWENTASQALARSLGLIHVFDIMEYE